MIPAFESQKVNSTLSFKDIKGYVRQIAAIAFQGC
jgi:hypothetical protein